MAGWLSGLLGRPDDCRICVETMMRKGTGRISRLSRTNIFAVKGLKLRPFGLLPAFWCTGACQHNGNFTLQIFQAQLGNVDYPIVLLMVVMAIRVVEFSRGGYKIGQIFA